MTCHIPFLIPHRSAQLVHLTASATQTPVYMSDCDVMRALADASHNFKLQSMDVWGKAIARPLTGYSATGSLSTIFRSGTLTSRIPTWRSPTKASSSLVYNGHPQLRLAQTTQRSALQLYEKTSAYLSVSSATAPTLGFLPKSSQVSTTQSTSGS